MQGWTDRKTKPRIAKGSMCKNCIKKQKKQGKNCSWHDAEGNYWNSKSGLGHITAVRRNERERIK